MLLNARSVIENLSKSWKEKSCRIPLIFQLQESDIKTKFSFGFSVNKYQHPC